MQGESVEDGSCSKSGGWPQTFESSMDIYSRSPSLGMLSASGSLEQESILGLHYHHLESGQCNVLKKPLLYVHQGRDESVEGNDPTCRKQTVDKEDLHDTSEGSTFLRASLNGMNVLAGVGILSTPYAAAEGGWLGMGFLLLFAVICCYTGVLLRRCMDVRPGIHSYPGIGEVAFGWKGRVLISILLYSELYAVAVEFLILEGDNLARLFPGMAIEFAGMSIKADQAFVLLSALIVSPTMWLGNLNLLAYVSAGGVAASILVVLAVGWVGAFDGVGFHHGGQLLSLSGLPTAVGLYAFCYSGHAVFPSIYSSLRDRTQFSNVLILCFVVCTLIYGSIAVMGYLMFGEALSSQVTLNLPKAPVASKVAICTTLVNPLAKYSLTLMPLARALEELLPVSNNTLAICRTGIRTTLVVSTVAVALLVPLFGYLMALIGSLLSFSVSIILPSLCYLKIFGSAISRYQMLFILTIFVVGLATSIVGTYSSLQNIAHSI